MIRVRIIIRSLTIADLIKQPQFRGSPEAIWGLEKGLVEKDQIDDRTNSYSLTQRGEREVEARREWEDAHLGEDLIEA